MSMKGNKIPQELQTPNRDREARGTAILAENHAELQGAEEKVPYDELAAMSCLEKKGSTLLALHKIEDTSECYRFVIKRRRRHLPFHDERISGPMFRLSKLLSRMRKYEEAVYVLWIVQKGFEKSEGRRQLYSNATSSLGIALFNYAQWPAESTLDQNTKTKLFTKAQKQPCKKLWL